MRTRHRPRTAAGGGCRVQVDFRVADLLHADDLPGPFAFFLIGVVITWCGGWMRRPMCGCGSDHDAGRSRTGV